MNDVIVGIDLGTTNSAVAVVDAAGPRIIPIDGEPLLPSVVGFGPDDSLLVGRAARNQYVAHPERTVRSVKRHMGEDTSFDLGGQELTPSEVASLILRRLKQAAEEDLGAPVERAVITVPAYFSDAQRIATREAGELAGLRVERIVNEPTAAALCYADPGDERRLYLVYDLGGGTFDVSVVRVQGDVTEVLSSHGDTRLGGDDFDAELVEHLRAAFVEEHDGVELPVEDLVVAARLELAAEAAKLRLSADTRTRVAEEHLIVEPIARHLDTEVDRQAYEALIEPYLERAGGAVQRALRDAGLAVSEIDDIILVGGSSRTPRVHKMLSEAIGRHPRSDVDPERAVALGAAILAARLAGREVGRILVDVTPHTFGTRVIKGDTDDHFAPIIPRNTALPARRTESFFTATHGQQQIVVSVLQGDAPVASMNHEVGQFIVEGLDPEARAGSEIIFEMRLDLNGILQVKVSERHTGLTKEVRIEGAFRNLDPEQLDESRRRLDALSPRSGAGGAAGRTPEDLTGAQTALWAEADALAARAHAAIPRLDTVDANEVRELVDELRGAQKGRDFDQIEALTAALSDTLFFLDP